MYYIVVHLEMAKKSLTSRNRALKRELFNRGYFVKTVGQKGEIDYLIVTVSEPRFPKATQGSPNQ